MYVFTFSKCKAQLSIFQSDLQWELNNFWITSELKVDIDISTGSVLVPIEETTGVVWGFITNDIARTL